MRIPALILASALTCGLAGPCLAWGPEGHSIVGEIAQSRLSPQAAQAVASLLRGRSLASIASWADDVRATRPETSNWHFVDIPLDVEKYNVGRDCKTGPQGDCVIAELGRLRNDLRCATGDAQVEALKFAVHFVGDIHQPLHTVLEKTGGNDIAVDVFMRGLATCPTCSAAHTPTNFHAVWDVNLITKTVWAWGSYVDRLEAGWLSTSADAKAEDPQTNHTPIDDATFVQWAEETHKAAPVVWYARPADDVLDDRYLHDVLPTLDRQLGIAGLRLARLLNQAYESKACPVK
jgi:S1/P1 Nuclease